MSRNSQSSVGPANLGTVGKTNAHSVEASFVIPCYRSTPALKALVSDLTALAREQLQRFEIILVRDSTDPDTTFLLDEIATTHQEARVIRLSRNFGQQAATVAGITESIGDVVVTLDDDYQHRPADALEMVAVLAREPLLHLVYARSVDASDSRSRTIAGSLFRGVLGYAGLKFADSLSPFRAFRGYFRDAFRTVAGPNVSVDIILSWVVDSVESMICEFNTRSAGKSGYSRRNLVKLALAILLTYTTRPLRSGVYLGSIGVALAIVFAAVILGTFLFGGITVPGFVTTTLLTLSLASLQLLVLGIVATYVGELHQRTTRQPTYFIVHRD